FDLVFLLYLVIRFLFSFFSFALNPHIHSFPTRRSSDLDYFDFERIEALKPAIEACGISTLSQSPMLGFHKQMDNRIKLNSRFKKIGRAVQQECRDRPRMPSSA